MARTALEAVPRNKAPWPPEGRKKRRPVGQTTPESFGSIAKEAQIDVWDLIEFNFKTRNPREVNWYLREYVGCVNTTKDGKNYVFRGAKSDKAVIYLPLEDKFPIAKWSVEKKREEAIRRSLKYMPAETAQVIEAMLTPEALAIMAGVTTVWAASHFVGIGEIVDLILLGVGVITLEVVGWKAVEELQTFVQDADAAIAEKGLESSAQHFAKAVSILGVQLIAAIVFKARPKKTFKQSKAISPSKLGKMPETKGKLFYRSKSRGRSSKKAGSGGTSIWGDIWYSTKGTLDQQRLAKIHETIHSLLTPKLQFLRKFRAAMGINSYKKSYILRYLEEALCETVAQLAVNGKSGFITGISFPLKSGHYHITPKNMAGEAAGILMGTINVVGQAYRVMFTSTKPKPPEPE